MTSLPFPYTQCDACGKIIRVNKWLLGDTHICLTREEREQVEREYDVKFTARGRPWLNP